MNGGVEIRVVGQSVVHLRTTPPLAAKIVSSPAGPGGRQQSPAGPGGDWQSPELVLVGTAAGLLEGDTVTVDIELGPGARLTVVTTAATIAHPCPGGGNTTLLVECRLGPGATLAWLPEPLIACRGCCHISRSHVVLAPGAAAVWLESCTLGRSGEEPGEVLQRLDVELDGIALLRESLGVGGRDGGSGWAGPAVLGAARHLASLHLLGRRLSPDAWPLPPQGVMALAGPGTTARFLATRADDLQHRLAAARPGFLHALRSGPPTAHRIPEEAPAHV